jgi:hypothetical protein
MGFAKFPDKIGRDFGGLISPRCADIGYNGGDFSVIKAIMNGSILSL